MRPEIANYRQGHENGDRAPERAATGDPRKTPGGGAPPVALAVPGYLRVDSDEGQALPDGKGVLWPAVADRDRAWAAERPKRYLAGAVMVGTVDQIMLGALRVKHAQLRSGPMLRLLLVVDEVHASDACMTEILRNALAQHAAAGGHALLLSATPGSLARLPPSHCQQSVRARPRGQNGLDAPLPQGAKADPAAPRRPTGVCPVGPVGCSPVLRQAKIRYRYRG